MLRQIGHRIVEHRKPLRDATGGVVDKEGTRNRDVRIQRREGGRRRNRTRRLERGLKLGMATEEAVTRGHHDMGGRQHPGRWIEARQVAVPHRDGVLDGCAMGDMGEEQPEEGDRGAVVLAALEQLLDRPFQRRECCLALALAEEQRGLRQHQCGPIAPEFPRQGGQPPGERFRLRAVDHGLRQGLEGVDRCARITALEVVAHRLRRFARLRPGLGRATMQHRQPVGLSFPKAPAQEGLEQVVVAIPVTLRLEPDRKEMLGDEIARHLRAVNPARDRLSQCGGEALEHRRLEQERLAFRRLAREHLLGQVVEQMTLAERAARTEGRPTGRPG